MIYISQWQCVQIIKKTQSQSHSKANLKSKLANANAQLHYTSMVLVKRIQKICSSSLILYSSIIFILFLSIIAEFSTEGITYFPVNLSAKNPFCALILGYTLLNFNILLEFYPMQYNAAKSFQFSLPQSLLKAIFSLRANISNCLPGLCPPQLTSKMIDKRHSPPTTRLYLLPVKLEINSQVLPFQMFSVNTNLLQGKRLTLLQINGMPLLPENQKLLKKTPKKQLTLI